MIKAVFFDLDGVLIDSETAQYNLVKEAIKDKNLSVPAEAYIMMIGAHKSQDIWKKIFEKYNPKETKEELREAFFGKNRDVFLNMNKKLIMFSDVPSALESLKKMGISLACASSSNIDYINKALTDCKIKEYFDLIVTSDDFKKAKPDPDIYLHCMEALNVSKEECLVVEDSAIGIAAAKAAGIKVFARVNPQIKLDQSKADEWISSLDELLGKMEG